MDSQTILDQILLRPGQLLKQGRYQVHRKLGTGLFSTTWLVSDAEAEFVEVSFPSKYCAVKVLSVEGTNVHKEGLSHELEFLQQIAADKKCENLPQLRDHFEEYGPGGTHLCLVMELLSTDVSSFRRSSPTKALPVYTVKHIIIAALRGLANLHRLGIIHTDLKLDNILFMGVPNDKYVEEQLAAEAPVIEGEVEVEGVTYPLLRAQPIPHTCQWDMSPYISEVIDYVVTDLGQAQRAGEQPTTDEFSAYSLRAPELLLYSDFSPKMDIWAIGCLTFELLVGRWLFAPKEGETWTLEDDHLAKMMELTGETFSSAYLARRRAEFFDENGKLLRGELIPGQSIENLIRICKIVPEDDIPGAASFINACLRLDTYDRSTAVELQMDPWLIKCSCSHYQHYQHYQ
ncbi:kinase-like protein [Gymnopilus junonius]|uniref:non-specific serine/threonine protein kinase n=1 Tax=Gymnopilus junonius TaxID=109634 RepID=A0A9P5NVQ8_GYMJU|nr:kinase-like protein [Gymnopilus junonius]